MGYHHHIFHPLPIGTDILKSVPYHMKCAYYHALVTKNRKQSADQVRPTHLDNDRFPLRPSIRLYSFLACTSPFGATAPNTLAIELLVG